MSSPRTPAIIGFLIAGSLVLGLGFFGDRISAGGDDALPALQLVEPRASDTLTNPVTLRFTTGTPLELHDGMGWMAGELHLHAMVDGVEVMPAAADISAAAEGYEWRLPPLPPGSHSIFLTWAARHHGNLALTSDTVGIFIR